MEFQNPYLIQRLKKPFVVKNEENPKANLLHKLASAFSFGGGLVNGGLSENAMQKLSSIWRYDYMGAAEFEWGAVPKSLDIMAKKQKSLITGQISVSASAIKWANGKSEKVSSSGIVFYVCDEKIETEVRNCISKFANPIEGGFFTKESVNLAENLVGFEYHSDTVGWHDIVNNFLFFTDAEMYRGFCELFGIEPVKSCIPVS